MERLQKVLSRAGVASRRAAEQLMLDGRVTVNGKTVRELGTKADPAGDEIKVDGRRTQLAQVRPLRPDVLEVTIREGRNRQVRKMCDAIGHPVTELRRVAIGPIRDAKLKVGSWRELTADEVRRLRTASAPKPRQSPIATKAVE